MSELRWPGATQPHATTDGWDHRDAGLQLRWRGPSARSNWVVPGRVLCGDQPYTLDKAEGRAGVAACDVSTIVCLRTKAEMAGGKNSYGSSMTKLIGKDHAKFLNFPIIDQNAADDALVSDFIEQLLERIAKEVCFPFISLHFLSFSFIFLHCLHVSFIFTHFPGQEVLYIHCHGGHGRTGTICSKFTSNAGAACDFRSFF